MSRYSDDYDGDEFPNQSALWQANAERALKGKRGRKALADLREALLALPEPRLIEGALCTVNAEKRAGGLGEDSWARREWAERIEEGEGVCAIGALLWHRKVKAGMDPAEAFDSLPTLEDSNWDLDATASLAVREAGLAYSLAVNLAYRNDETYEGMTPEGRYTAFLAWIDRELAEVSTA
jgi:hypothetical protein